MLSKYSLLYEDLLGLSEFNFKCLEPTDNLDDIFRLRYQVYCHESRFFKPEDFPDKKETDLYDEHSVHFSIDHFGLVIGACRLILNSPFPFPFEKLCRNNLTVDISKIPRKCMAEISRLVITKTFRRRQSDGLYYSDDILKSQKDGMSFLRRRIRPITFGLYLSMYFEARMRGITHVFAVMEKSLCKLLQGHGFNFYPIGEEFDYSGPVRPYMYTCYQFEEDIRNNGSRLKERFFDKLDDDQREMLNSFIDPQKYIHYSKEIKMRKAMNVDLDKVHFTEIYMKQSIQSVVDDYQNKYSKGERVYELHIDAEDVIGTMDDDLLHFMMKELLDNSTEYTDKGLINVTLIDDEDCWLIKIKDAAGGIDQTVIEHILSYDSSDADHLKDKGYGLKRVKRIVELHSGKINIISIPDQGTEVKILLPKKLPQGKYTVPVDENGKAHPKLAYQLDEND